MVVPIKNKIRRPMYTRVFPNLIDKIGNCKEYFIDCNSSTLKVVGNSNNVFVKENSGLIEIVGNYNNLKVLKNNGQIQYIGNEGKIYLGQSSNIKTVKYVGCNGLLKIPKTNKSEKKIFANREHYETSSSNKTNNHWNDVNVDLNVCIHNNKIITSSSSQGTAPQININIT